MVCIYFSLTPALYESLSEQFLDNLLDHFENIAETCDVHDDFDVTYNVRSNYNTVC